MTVARIAKWVGAGLAAIAAGVILKLAASNEENPDGPFDPPDFYTSDPTLLDGSGTFTVQEKLRIDAGTDWPIDPCGARYLIRFESGRYVWGETSKVTCVTPDFRLDRPESYQIYWLSDAWNEWEAEHERADASP